MPILQIRNLPQELFDELKASAAASRRSLNQEAIVLLEMGLRKVTPDPRGAKDRLLRQLLSMGDTPCITGDDAVEWIRKDRDSR